MKNRIKELRLNEKFPSVRYSPLGWEDINFLGE